MPTLCPRLLPSLALAVTLPAHALDWSVDLFATPVAEVKADNRATGVESESDDPDGFGARVVLWPGRGPLFYAAEWSRLKGDRNDGNLEQARLGIGVVNATAFYTRFELIHTEAGASLGSSSSDASTLGAGLHAGLAGALSDWLLASAEVGYVDLDLIDDDDALHPGQGLQATVRGEVPLSTAVQLFSELRYQQPRDDEDGRNLRYEIGEWRLGVRLNF
ncbi:hypothetical protein JN531_008285 [Flagellatimonas centrodinii]|uniref:hypothetical protein n=1 Tax=Flagellatimonas centrodinii TaxID=2806210 RepID=UPI001FEF0B73|nr:hypothetical protein [Flagellatimonas centrodinii]ULQ45124.1 hypothetical protein JN531_008285 [Flagellatimonas centrodinii]